MAQIIRVVHVEGGTEMEEKRRELQGEELRQWLIDNGYDLNEPELEVIADEDAESES